MNFNLQIQGVVDVPLYLMSNLFSYWPFGPIISRYWASYDNNIKTTTNLHMLYLIYTTIRSIKAPRSFQNELLIKRPIVILFIFWIIGFTTWIPVVNYFGTVEFTNSIRFTPLYLQSIINFFAWFLIVDLIFILSLYLLVLIEIKRGKIKKYKQRSFFSIGFLKKINFSRLFKMNNLRNNKLKLIKRRDLYWDAQLKFVITIFFYLLQWFPPSLITIMEPLCSLCISLDLSIIILRMI